MSEAIEALNNLFLKYHGDKINDIEQLPQSGSYRQYYRIKHLDKTILGVYNTDLQENRAYLSFSKTFEKTHINIPKIIAVSSDETSYFVEDLGNSMLRDIAMQDINSIGQLSEKSIKLYEKTLQELINIQTKTINDLDLSFCYPRDSFDKQSMLWDLNYFKYMFLRVLRVPFDEQLLENDFQKLSQRLDLVDRNFFLFRDFQSRNVMIKNETPYFIDFQGGRKGSIFYDLASILYDANTPLNIKEREHLLDFYYQRWKTINTISHSDFISLFHQFAIIRLTQALGAFGLRGVIEQKPHFKDCIPFALTSLLQIFDTIPKEYPELSKTIHIAKQSDYIKSIIK